MKFASYEVQGKPSCGLVEGDRVIDLRSRMGASTGLLGLLESGRLLEAGARCARQSADFMLPDVRLLPAIPRPRTIACVGHNYEEHRLETQRDPTDHPSIFFRHPGSLVGSGEVIVRPHESTQLDYEGELAVIIGTGGRRIAQSDAWSHVVGVSCFNDGSVRDWQHHTRQFGPGKNFEKTAAFGPYLVTLDELPADRSLALTTRVNGQVVQHAMTDQMIFSIPRVIAYVSIFMALQPGDVIATGTPGGVGVKRKPPVWLLPGDSVEVEISAVGVLTNRVVQEA